ncbi:hypothetical protein BJ875DRAFT_538715 [Amylocarpus encephaloides]|uniref:RRM domain-containing protein n=1 Tax=Amylocarpus encephaloides TaxID=45428 RepID=A0A9P7YTK8_9HELO|nr:hypothetical protein BJ875DRAFT_538715 [Amylocarpus encephaloides]
MAPPHVAAMAQVSAIPLVRQQKTPASVTIPYLKMPMSFFDIPDSAPAHFSTHRGQLEKRVLPLPLPVSLVRSNILHDVKWKVQHIRDEYPTIASSITEPAKWEDLYQYFDGFDLYVQGASFCYYVVQTLGQQNRCNKAIIAREIDLWAAEWINFHSEQVLNGPPNADLIEMFTMDEHAGLETMTLEEIKLMFVGLEKHRDIFLSSIRPRVQPLYPVQERFYTPALTGPFASQIPNINSPQRICPNHIIALQPVSLHQPPIHPNNNTIVHDQNQRQTADSVHSVPTPRNDGRNMRATDRRRMSNESSRTSLHQKKNQARFNNQEGRHTVSNTPHQSPRSRQASDEPVYINTSQPPASPRSKPFANRFSHETGPSRFSNDARVGATPFSPHHGHRGSHLTNFQNDSQILQGDVNATQIDTHPRHRGSQHMEIKDVKDLFEGDPKAYVHNSSQPTCTYFYIGEARLLNRNEIHGERRLRTAWVGNVPRSYFTCHKLKDLMSACGEVESIHYLFGSAVAFVTFTSEESLPAAIKKFTRYKLKCGTIISINESLGNQIVTRNRSNSQMSQKSYGYGRSSNFPCQDLYQYPRRRYSNNRHGSGSANGSFSQYNQFGRPIQPQDGSMSFPNMQNGFESQLMSTVSEMNQHKYALDRLPMRPALDQIENPPYSARKAINGDSEFGQGSALHANQSTRKPFENNTSIPGKSRNNKRASRSNTSTIPTPAASPVKSRSMANLCSMLHQSKSHEPLKEKFPTPIDIKLSDSLSSEQSQTSIRDKPNGKVGPIVKNKKTSKHIHKGEGTSGSKESGELSLLTSKPTAGLAESNSFLNRTETQASLAESSPCRSKTSTKSEVSLPQEGAMSTPAAALSLEERDTIGKDTPKYQSAAKKGQSSGPKARKNEHSKSMSNGVHGTDNQVIINLEYKKSTIAANNDPPGISANIGNQFDSASDDSVNRGHSKTQGRNEARRNKAQPSKSHRSMQSNASTKSHETIKSDNEDPSNAKWDERSKSSPAKNCKNSASTNLANRNEGERPQKGHTKKGNSFSSAGSSVRKADLKALATSGGVLIYSLTSSVATPAEKKPKNLIEDPKQWPALGPSYSPLSLIADGKRPAAIPESTFRPVVPRKITPGGIVPAVPIIKRPRPQLEDPLGGPDWPFVRSCRPIRDNSEDVEEREET